MLKVIAIFKLAKGVLLLAVGVGVVELLHKDIADAITAWADQLHLDPDGRLVQAALEHAGDLTTRRLVALSAGMFFYAALLLTEGIGLLLRQRWAEYFTVIVTASFVPLELYEIVQRLTIARVAALVINVAIVWFLILRLRRGRRVEAAPLEGTTRNQG